MSTISRTWKTNLYKIRTGLTASSLNIFKAVSSLVGYNWFLDEDDMDSDSATKVPSQQSVKAYVDNTRYTDAVDAMGAKANDNPLNHDRYTDTEADNRVSSGIGTHTSNAAAHHTRYTDTEASDAAEAQLAANDAKTTPVDGDGLPLLDSEAGSTWKLVTWTNAWVQYFKTKADALYVAIAKWTWQITQFDAGSKSGAMTLTSGNGHTQYCTQTGAATDPLAVTWTAGYNQISIKWNDTGASGGPNLTGFALVGTIPASGVYWIVFDNIDSVEVASIGGVFV